MILSVIIPARNEFPNVVHTIHSILNSWEASGFDRRDIEIILVDNCSDDDYFPQRGTKGTTSYLEGRGIYFSGVLRILRDPIAGNHSARNKGAEIAKGKYLFFSDAHMSYSPEFFKHILKAVDETHGIVHAPIAWMGGYPPQENGGAPHGLGFQYTIKLGEEIKGTWNPYVVSNEEAFYIPALGHCSLAMDREQFLDFGGYPKIHRCYGGGEFYLNMKWWMFGSTVAVEPKAIGYHLASSRGYSYNHDDYLHNVINIGLALGMDDWVERAYMNWLRKGRKEVLDGIIEEAIREVAEDKAFIESRRTKTFNEVIVERPWDKLNDAKFGRHNSGLSIFHKTWLPLIKGTPAEKVYPGKYQEGLAKFIEENLKEFEYGR